MTHAKTSETISPKKRIFLLDELRGFAVLCMIFYHAFYTLAYLCHLDWGLKLLFFFMPAEPFFAALFIFISGISSDLSHSNLKRGLKLAVIAVAVSVVTAVVVPDELIVFGILHFLSVCMILFGLLKSKIEKIPFSWGWVLLCGVLYFFTFSVSQGYLGLKSFPIYLPDWWYEQNFLFPLGLCSSTFRSSDYFPLLPWVFVFLAGTFVGRFAVAGKFPMFMYRSRVPFFSFLGRHALIIYIAHQPVIYGIVLLFGLLR